MAVQLIIFDLDGTLVDSSRDIAEAINDATSSYGLRPITVEETISLIGEGVTRLFEKLLVTADDRMKHDIQDRFLSYYTDHLTDHATLYPGVAETLSILRGKRKAVVSNKREQLSKRLLSHLGLDRHFDLILGSDSLSERKPSPLPIFHAMERLGARPAETVVVGDSTYDIDAGRAAGACTVAVTYGYREAALLKDADFRIDALPELLRIIDECNDHGEA